MSTAAKRQIIVTLNDLPEQSLAAVAEFLRAKAAARPASRAPARPAKPGSLRTTQPPSEVADPEGWDDFWESLVPLAEPLKCHPTGPADRRERL